jgi:hypothetical protein
MARIPSACGIRSKEVVNDTNCSYYLAINTQPAMVFSRLAFVAQNGSTVLHEAPLGWKRAYSGNAGQSQKEFWICKLATVRVLRPRDTDPL